MQMQGKIAVRVLLAASAMALASPAAANVVEPIALGDGVAMTLLAHARLRYETVDQAHQADDADALTARLRLGAELRAGLLSILLEGEGTTALVDNYNDTLARNGAEPYPIVADPETLELNRAQVAFMRDGTGITLGRQRINLDNQRFVGSVSWRQNEQTFDAVRGQARIGPVKLDATYAFSQRTIFGARSQNERFNGDFVLLNGQWDTSNLDITVFSYLLDYDARPAMSSATYGLSAQGFVRLGPARLALMGTLATQADLGANPVNYSATYVQAEAGLAMAGLSLRAGHERLGSDDGQAAFQTPLATLHAFNGWADQFLTTPAAGLRDYHLKAGYAVPNAPVPGLNLQLAWHHFESDLGSQTYGREWNASLGMRLGRVNVLLKYADYDARSFGVNTRKAWLQAEYAF